jgi:cytochrome c5
LPAFSQSLEDIMKTLFPLLRILPCLIVLQACSQARDSEALAQGNPDYQRGMHIYNTFCAECHEEGRNGAPRLDDVDDWNLRAMQWSSVLKSHATEGFMDMPQKGGHPELSDQNISDALYYMQIKIRAEEE